MPSTAEFRMIELRPERFPGLGPLHLLRCTRAVAHRIIAALPRE